MSTLAITIIQSQLHWEDKDANLRMFEEKINSIQDRMEVVVLPEMFSTGFSMNPQGLAENMDGPTLQWMRKITATKNIVLTGSVIIEENGNYYNRLIWMLPNGDLGYYDKRHRFAYAGEDQHYAAGNKRLIASVKGWKINLQICYDLRFPVWSHQSSPSKPSDGQETATASPEYDLLIYVANWPERRVHAWKTLLQARAIENQCYAVGVNRTGKDGNNLVYSGESMIVDAMGEVLYSRAHHEDIYTIELQKEKLDDIRNKLPFLRDADRFFIEL
jgi:predicted amidohydrolase